MLSWTKISSELAALTSPFAALLTLLLLVTATLYLKLLRHAKQPGKKLTWRIRGIPINITKEDLQSQLEEKIQSLPRGSSQHIVEIPSLVPSSSGFQCATVICEEFIVHALEDKWVIDKSFLGITPLSNTGNAKVE